MLNLLDTQRELEADMQARGIDYYRHSVRKAREQGKESRTIYGVTLMKKAVDSVSQGLRDFLEEAHTGVAGYRHTSAKILAMCDIDTAAYLGLKFVMDGISTKQPMTKIAMAIAGALEDQHKWELFNDKDKMLFIQTMHKVTEKTTNRYYRRYNINLTSKKILLEWEPWAKQEKLHLGCKIIDMIIQQTGLVELVTHVFGRNKRQLYVVPNQKTLEWIEKVNERGELLSPHYMPCVVPPRDWVDPWNGGYHTEHIKPFPMIKTHNVAVLDAAADRNMPMEYKAINALQGTRWAVNDKVLEIMQFAWESGDAWAGVPPREPLPLPPTPFPDMDKADMDPDQLKEFKAWKNRAAKVYQTNARLNSKRIQFVRTLAMAKKFAEHPEFYYVYQNDFRGRKYVTVSFMSPQGTDFSKALLQFAHGMELGDTGVKWLMIHGANCFGVDKVSFENRLIWTKQHEEAILECARDPLSNRWWTEADNPWCFLAFCFEYEGYVQEGKNFRSKLPIALDGSNNGLQHLSACLRDMRGGIATNLVPSEVPQDIYQQVADVVCAELSTRAKSGDRMAQEWLDFGVNRKTTKRPVMVVPYGGTLFSCRQYIEDYICDKIDNGAYNPWGGDTFKPSAYLSDIVWRAIGEVVVSAREVMGWLQDVGSLISKGNKPVEWVSPSGFPVNQQYYEVRSRRITTYIDGSLIKPQLREPNAAKIDKRRAVNGVSPNFIHSLDAAAMTMTICKCVDEGIKDFAMIHDSYGVHAAETDKLFRILREAFVELYTEHDPLSDFKAQAEERGVQPPEIPQRGTLNIEGVQESLYFFA